MILGDSMQKLHLGREKFHKILKQHDNFTIMSTGITADDCRIALASVNAGVKIIEINHPSICLAMGLGGVKTMKDSEEIRYKLPKIEVIKKIQALRRILGEDVYITVAIPGLFTELIPTPLTKDDFYQIALAGADGLHVHKSTLEDLKNVVDSAHEMGLLVDSYISNSNDKHFFGIAADSEIEVQETARKMVQVNVDFIGIMMGQSYKGKESTNFNKEAIERLEKLVNSVDVPTLAEGGITIDNIASIKETGVNVAVVGTYLDDFAKKSIASVIGDLIRR